MRYYRGGPRYYREYGRVQTRQKEHRQGAVDPQERYYHRPMLYYRKTATGQAQ